MMKQSNKTSRAKIKIGDRERIQKVSKKLYFVHIMCSEQVCVKFRFIIIGQREEVDVVGVISYSSINSLVL